MTIFLAILKWIGIILSGVAALLIILLALVLFVPVKYTVMAESRESVRYAFSFRWLFPLVYIKKGPDQSGAVIYILGIPVKKLYEEDRKEEKEKSREEHPLQKQKEADVPKSQPVSRTDRPERKAGKQKKGHKKGHKKKKNRFSFESVSGIIKFIREEDTRMAFLTAKNELWALIRYLSPQKVEGDLQIGTGDPATTGLLFGGISLMPFVYQKGVHIVPDFEQKIVRGNGKIKGRIRVIFFIRLAIRVYRDDKLRKVWNRINKKEAA